MDFDLLVAMQFNGRKHFSITRMVAPVFNNQHALPNFSHIFGLTSMLLEAALICSSDKNDNTN